MLLKKEEGEGNHSSEIQKKKKFLKENISERIHEVHSEYIFVIT